MTPTRPKLLFVHEMFGRLAGAEQNILVTAPHLAEAFDLAFLHWKRSGRDEAAFAALFPTPHAVDFASPDEAGVERAVAQVLATERPDLAYVHKCVSLPVTRALLAAGLPVVRMEHDHDVYCMRSYKYSPWTRRICTRRAGPCCLFPCLAFLARDRRRGAFGFRWVSYCRQMELIRLNRRFDAHFVVTRYMRDELIRQGFPPERIHLFPPIPPPGPAVADRRVAGGHRILFVGQIVRGKGLDCLLRALPLLHEPWELVVLGDGSHRRHCEELAARLDLGGRVHFAGFVSQEQLTLYYKEAVLVVVPSVWPEPIATIGLEVLRHGLPVVGFDAGGIRDWLIDGETGCLVPWMDIPRLADRIDHLLRHREEARRLGEQGRAFVNRHFAFDAYIDRFKETFAKLIAGRSAGG
ncbi:MAG: glycosyltransferase family 4 protein [Lentisphaeria bacterium]